MAGRSIEDLPLCEDLPPDVVEKALVAPMSLLIKLSYRYASSNSQTSKV